MVKVAKKAFLQLSPFLINRPGVAGAVLQTPPWLIKWLTYGLWKYVQNNITPILLELESWNLKRRLTPRHVSRFMYHMSRVTVTCYLSNFFNKKNEEKNDRKNMKKVWKRGGASPWRVCYQRSLPHLVFHTFT